MVAFHGSAIEVFPAYAGVSPEAQKTSWSTMRLPRLRGGEPSVLKFFVPNNLSSPPTRG